MPIDDTYSYYLMQGETELKHGFVRLTPSPYLENNGFDYAFDFLLN